MDLSEQVEQERRAEEARQVQEEEEEARRAEENVKKAKIEARKGALGDARNAALAVFHAKTLSKEELQWRNVELAAEARAIKRAEAGDEDKEERENNLKFVTSRLLNFEGLCDRCAGFKSQPCCVVNKGAPKCKKCTNEVQGCYWDCSRQGLG